MVDQTADFVGSIPDHYDRCLGPILFDDYAKYGGACGHF